MLVARESVHRVAQESLGVSIFFAEKVIFPPSFSHQNSSHGLVTFSSAVFLMGCARMWIELLVATGPLTARFFLGFFFEIALARVVLGMVFGRLGHWVGFLRLDSIAVTFSLIGTGLLPLIAFPILFIGQFMTPNLRSLDTSLGTIAIQVMIGMEMPIAPFEQASPRRS